MDQTLRESGIPRSHHGLGNLHSLGVPAPVDAQTAQRREAIAELGRALHDLVQVAVATEVETAELMRAAAAARALAAPLAQSTRTRDEFPRADDLIGGIRMYNPVTGPGSAFAPPLHIALVGDRAEATCTLGLAYEGPPRHVHGGVSALLLDQLLGFAVAATGRPGMTRELAMRYRRPVPLLTQLQLSARVVELNEDGRTVVAAGTITTTDDPSTVLVEATGTFVQLHPDQARRVLFTRSGAS